MHFVGYITHQIKSCMILQTTIRLTNFVLGGRKVVT
jgi:hypothetical protein